MTELIVHMPVGIAPKDRDQGLARRRQRKKERVPLAALLNVTLANTIDLKGRVMHAKWRARQCDSNGLALVLDEFGDDLDLMADLLGQRVVAMGHDPKALPAEVMRVSRLPPFKGAILWEWQLIDMVTRSVDATKHYIEPAIGAAVEAGDAVTKDLLQRLNRRLLRW